MVIIVYDEAADLGVAIARILAASLIRRSSWLARSSAAQSTGCFRAKTVLALTLRQLLNTRRKWLKLDGSNALARVIDRPWFKDMIRATHNAA